jgi:branched-chain amino acid transport system ATP-binding protein
MLTVEGLEAGYGSASVLHGVDFEVAEGERVALLGRNGMGKTTTIKAILGMIRPRGGRVRLAGRDLTGWPSHRIARAGLGLVPEGRQISPALSVGEHLRAFARPGPAGAAWRVGDVLEMFPRLADRLDARGGHLSGGEQQMLAIGRALVTNPRLLILDEATEGLAPKLREEIWQRLELLRVAGRSLLVIDKPCAALDRLADRLLVMEKGRITWSGSPAALRATPGLSQRLLGV